MKLEQFNFKIILSMTFSTQRQKVSHKCLFSVFPKVFLHTAGKKTNQANILHPSASLLSLHVDSSAFEISDTVQE